MRFLSWIKPYLPFGEEQVRPENIVYERDIPQPVNPGRGLIRGVHGHSRYSDVHGPMVWIDDQNICWHEHWYIPGQRHHARIFLPETEAST